ncbi:recombinase family protein [Poseidonocella sedimentorum]|uniref:recombinase family protein n=1 Tax=Poseidonocella sedimentorum TaxID=871652 RepID=UPI003182CE8D
MADIEDGLIDIVVVYKIDRLSRALMDFSKLVEIFDKHGVTFVSVKQSFNTTTSMGRLTLSILLSFAQFEREVIGERIRDKVAASRKKGIWMGGPVPLGYNVRDRKLIVDPVEAETVRTIFTLYARSSSTAQVILEMDARAILTKTGRPYDKTSLIKSLHNKVYRGLAVRKGTAYPGEHDAIIDATLWDEVHVVIANNRYLRKAAAQEPSPALLRGLIFTEIGVAMTPHHTKKGTRRYRYYVSMDVIKKRPKAELRGPQRLPGGMVEDAVVGEIRRLLRTPEVAARVSRTLRKDRPDLGEAGISASLTQFDEMWNADPRRAGPRGPASGGAGHRQRRRVGGRSAPRGLGRDCRADGPGQVGGGDGGARNPPRPHPAHPAQSRRPPPHPAAKRDRGRHGSRPGCPPAARHRPRVGLAAQARARRRQHHRRSRQRGRHLRPLCQPRDPAGMARALRAGAAGAATRAHGAVDLRLLWRVGTAVGRAAGTGV